LSEIDMDQSLASTPTPVPPGSAQPDEGRTVIQRTARAASLTGLRQGLSMGLAAVTVAVVARVLGSTNYGYYAGGMAVFQLALAFTDLGFSLVATREMARHPDRRGVLLRSTVQVQLAWSTVVAAALVVIGLLTGARPRGEVILVMAPVVLLSGLASFRQIFLVLYMVGRLFVLDTVTAVVQSVAMVAVALLRYGLVAIAGACAATTCANAFAVTWMGRNLVDRAPGTQAQRRRIVRLAVPLGIASVIASLYFTIDQVLLTWLVPAAQLGYYAAAVKLLTVVVTVPGFIMQAGIPALARAHRDRAEVSDVAGRLAHWIAATAFPLCVGLLVFAGPVVRVVFGPAFAASAPLLRILMLAGTLSLMANVLGIVLSSLSIVRPQLIFNLATLVVNVVGNLLLVPRYGVSASAWLTAACEAIVVSYGIVALRRHVYLRRLIAPSSRSLVAAALAGAVGVALGANPLLAVPVAIAIFVSLVLGLRSWPQDLVPGSMRR
jgi:O-antigen/teichoic acid export membrane protein